MTDTPILRTLSAAVGATDDTPDDELLRRFAGAGDQSAFELVVRRHAELVWRTCRAVLPHHADAENAFQAAFLILARKAAAVRDPSAAGWLFRVSRNVALRARKRAARQSADPLPDALADTGVAAEDAAALREAAPIVAEEVARLAAKFREPIVLCVFEGHTHAVAATRLGWPVGTVASRLARAKDVLRDRLVRRGVVLPAAGLATVFLPAASAALVPLVRSASATATGPAGGVPPAVLSLTNGVLSAMRSAQLKVLAATSAIALGLTAALVATSGDVRAVLVTRAAAPPTAADEKEAGAKDLKALQGKWRAVKSVTDGGEVPAHVLVMSQATFEGDVCTLKGIGEAREKMYVDESKVRVRLAPGQSPKEMDLTRLDGAQKGDTLRRIYKLDGDTLTVCWSYGPDGLETGDRPKEFKSAKGVMLSVLERVKDANDELRALAGEWKAVSASVSGRAVPAEEVAKERWVIKGAELTLAVGAPPEEKAELKLDPAALPPTFDFTITEGKEKGHVLRGIYFRQGDKLTLAIRDPKTKKNDRPTELKPGDGVVFEVLKRQK